VVSKRSTDAIKALSEHFRIHAHTDTKVIGHFEKATWNYGSVKLCTQPFQEIIGVASSQLHERSRAPICPDCSKRGLLYEKIPKQFPVRINNPARFFAKPIQVFKCGDREK
jgi:hypothetical protein